MLSDTEIVDWLEREANAPGGLLLHDGSETGRRGIGLRPGNLNRTLRQAVSDAVSGDVTVPEPRRRRRG